MLNSCSKGSFYPTLLVFVLGVNALFSQTRFINYTSSSQPIKFTAIAAYDTSVIYAGGWEQNLMGYSNTIIKMNSNGAVLWSKKFGQGGENGLRALATDFQGNLFVGGYISKPSNWWDMAISKLNSEGNILWSQRISPLEINECNAIAHDGNGGVIGVGYTKNITNPAGLAVRLRADGSVAWAKAYFSDQYDVFYSVTPAEGGNFIITGTHSIYTDVKPLILKIDSLGNPIWARTIQTNTYGQLSSVIWTSDEAYAAAGEIDVNSGTKFCLMKFSSNGSLTLFKVYGGFSDEAAYSISETVNNDLLLTGATNGFNSTGSVDMMAIRVNREGQLIWGKTYSLPGFDRMMGAVLSADGGSFIAGYQDDSPLPRGIVLKTTQYGDAGCFTNNIFPLEMSLFGQYQVQNVNFSAFNILQISGAEWESVNANVQTAYYCYMIPVELKSYNYRIEKNSVTIDWTTASETNNRGFELYRNDERIAFIEGQGTSTNLREYTYTDEAIPGRKAHYRLLQIDFDGTQDELFSFDAQTEQPAEFTLMQNYPNPFNPGTRIDYILPAKGYIKLQLIGLSGEVLEVIEEGEREAGYYSTELNLSNYGSGVYLCRLVFNDKSITRKIALIK
ncbi:MAG: T9SS type A sorting domain-containing protein [Ignavibacteriaceae bacterium]|nr:T9SS type A sorting domain-containing protein [Ignavibacteriaceae bacterium]